MALRSPYQRRRHHLLPTPLLFLVFTILPRTAYSTSTADLPTPSPTAQATLPFIAAITTPLPYDFDPDPTDPPSLSQAANPFATPDASIPTSTANPDSTTSSHALLNYYFLLLFVFVALLLLGYYVISRRRRKALLYRQNVQHTALSTDLERWPGQTRSRWRGASNTNDGNDGAANRGEWEEIRGEEGLDERGEAPPPYALKKPERVASRDAEEIELREFGSGEGKPPDYDGGARPGSSR